MASNLYHSITQLSRYSTEK